MSPLYESGSLEYSDVFAKAGEGHRERRGNVGDAGRSTRELGDNGAPGWIRDCRDDAIEVALQDTEPFGSVFKFAKCLSTRKMLVDTSWLQDANLKVSEVCLCENSSLSVPRSW